MAVLFMTTLEVFVTERVKEIMTAALTNPPKRRPDA
jgi:hypothetical protein